jgi:hypothetical protein
MNPPCPNHCQCSLSKASRDTRIIRSTCRTQHVCPSFTVTQKMDYALIALIVFALLIVLGLTFFTYYLWRNERFTDVWRWFTSSFDHTSPRQPQAHALVLVQGVNIQSILNDAPPTYSSPANDNMVLPTLLPIAHTRGSGSVDADNDLFFQGRRTRFHWEVSQCPCIS